MTNNTAFRAKDFLVRSRASFRMLFDAENWDAARMIIAPGQSGDTKSKFYDNLLKNWANHSDFPMLFSREQVEAQTALRLRLIPKLKAPK